MFVFLFFFVVTLTSWAVALTTVTPHIVAPGFCDFPSCFSKQEAIEYGKVYYDYVNLVKNAPPTAACAPRPGTTTVPYDCALASIGALSEPQKAALTEKHISMNTKACSAYERHFGKERYKIWYMLDTYKCRVEDKNHTLAGVAVATCGPALSITCV